MPVNEMTPYVYTGSYVRRRNEVAYLSQFSEMTMARYRTFNLWTIRRLPLKIL